MRVTQLREQLQSVRNSVDELLLKQRTLVEQLSAAEAEYDDLLGPAPVTLTQRIIDLINSAPHAAHDLDEIASRVGSKKPNSVRTLLHRLEKAGHVRRDAAGLYWSPGSRGGESP